MELLSLGNNQISELTPEIVQGLENLKEFTLLSNKFQTILPGTFKYLQRLEVLSLAFNQISKKNTPESFEGLDSLKELSFSGTSSQFTIIGDIVFPFKSVSNDYTRCFPRTEIN